MWGLALPPYGHANTLATGLMGAVPPHVPWFPQRKLPGSHRQPTAPPTTPSSNTVIQKRGQSVRQGRQSLTCQTRQVDAQVQRVTWDPMRTAHHFRGRAGAEHMPKRWSGLLTEAAHANTTCPKILVL